MPDEVNIQGQPRILIADDDPAARLTLAEQLSQHFDIVAVAADTEQAITLAERHHPDLALIDAHMPAGGGIRATREIARRCPRTAICALSTDELEHEVLDILIAGAMAYTLKWRPQPELERLVLDSLQAHSTLSANRPATLTTDSRRTTSQEPGHALARPSH